jgi:hypothetical protein
MSILNREFRDYSAEALYPFEDSARMTNTEGVTIPSSLFLDMIVYSLLDRELPFYLYSIDGKMGTEEEVGLTVRDRNNREVCSGIMGYVEDTAYLYDEYGRLSATVVYDKAEAENLIHRVKGKTVYYSNADLPLLCGRCFVTRPKGLSIVQGGGEDFTQDVYIVAANGIHFTQVGGRVYINMLGEESLLKKPIRTVNGRNMKHVWLAAHPNSAVKVETKAGKLKIWKINDVQ